MNAITSFFRQFPLQKILIVFVAGITLFLSTACSGEKLQSANPNGSNIPVQAGANNNPYTMGTDSKGEPVSGSNYGNRAYSNNQHSDASTVLPGGTLIASSVSDSDPSEMLYESSDQRRTQYDNLSPEERAVSLEAIPARRQPSGEFSNPNERLLENVGDQFKQASKFLNEDVRSAVENAKVKTGTGQNQSVARQSEQ